MDDSIRTIRRKTCNALIDSLNRYPDMWRWMRNDNCVVGHVNGVEIWWYAGAANLYKPEKVKFDWISYYRLRRALKRWNNYKGKAQLQATEIQACMTVIEMFARGEVA